MGGLPSAILNKSLSCNIVKCNIRKCIIRRCMIRKCTNIYSLTGVNKEIAAKPCIYWAAAIFLVVMDYSNVFMSVPPK